MRKLSLFQGLFLLCCFLATGFFNPTNAQDLFFSEYHEGSGFEKYLEVYNPTASAVNLGNYQIRTYFNGSGSPGATNTLSGTLAPGAVIVYKNSSATLFAGGINISACNFNGDDAVVLYNTSTNSFADIIGQIGCDPGSEWNDGAGHDTQNGGIIRKSSVTGGVTSNPGTACTAAAGFPTLATEWDDVAQNNVSNLGQHTGATTGPCSQDLFISEYIEGGGNNKCVEVANFTGATVNLSGYQIRTYHNGSNSATFTINLSGTVADGDVHVVCNANAQAAFLAQADATGSIFVNGDDAIALVKVNTSGSVTDTLDIFGQIGCDPGCCWGTFPNVTTNHTIVRKSSVTGGVTSNPTSTCNFSSGFPTLNSEWTFFAQDFVSDLGQHSVNCGPATAPNVALGNDTVLCPGESLTLDAGNEGDTYSWSTGGSSQFETVTTSGVYTVTVTNSAGSTTDEIAVLIGNTPNAAITSSANPSCAGAAVNFTSNLTLSDLIISEYMEGSSLNKCIEFFNGTGAAINLAAGNYSIDVSYNGGSFVANIPLTGTIADGGTHVLCDDGAFASTLAKADQTTTQGLWNGDDAIILKKGSQVLDIFGNPGNDPGSQWGNASAFAENNTQNRTLRRNCDVLEGVTVDWTGTGNQAFITLNSQWTEYPQNDIADLGSHSLCPSYLWSNGATTANTTMSPSSDQNVSLVIGHDGCSTTLNYEQQVDNPQVSATNDEICEGGSATLTASFNTNDLFISQYIEGFGNNKCIEFYNGTGADIDLGAGGYAIDLSFNGGVFNTTINLSGVVADGDVHVLCYQGASGSFLSAADQTTSTFLWNGDDAIILKKGSQTLDIFGRPGDDPGSQWTSGSNSTQNATLIRNSNVVEGVTIAPTGTGSGAFTTLGSEWSLGTVNSAAGLGSHSFSDGGSYAWSNGDTGPSTTVSTGATTAYTVTYTSPSGCTASATGTVAVNPNPKVDAGDCFNVFPAYGPAACQKLTANVTSGTAPFTYQWMNVDNGNMMATTQDMTVCPTVTTNYRVVVTDSKGCSGFADVRVNVIDISCGKTGKKIAVCHIPPGNKNNPQSICISKSAVPAHWNQHGGDVLGECGTIDPCTGSAFGGVTNKTFASNSAQSLSEDQVTAYPNPFQRNTTIEFTLLIDSDVTLEIFNGSGHKITTLYNGHVHAGVANSFEFDASELSAGIYFYRLSTNEKTYLEKLIVTE